jgi:hypothetical protein
MYDFCQQTNARLMFDLNQVQGWNANAGVLDMRSVIQILNYVQNKGYQLDFEFGNG